MIHKLVLCDEVMEGFLKKNRIFALKSPQKSKKSFYFLHYFMLDLTIKC